MNNKRMIGQYTVIDFVLFIVCCFGLYFISQKASLPFKLLHSQGEIRIFDAENSDLPEGALLVSLNDNLISSYESIEFIIDGYKIDDIVKIGYLCDQQFKTSDVKLTSFYGTFYLLIAAVTGLIYFLLGIIVLVKTDFNKISIIFHCLSLSVAGIIMMSWGMYNNTFLEIGYLTRFAFHICYLAAPVMFIHFALIFPNDKLSKNLSIIKSVYIVAAILAIIINLFFIAAVINHSQAAINAYLKSFGILRVFIIICVLISIVVFINSYLSSKQSSDRNKLKWILVGFITGPVIYIVLWVIPQLLNIKEPLSEELIVLLSNSVPVTFAIAIVKYHLFDIDYLINRSIVYTLLLMVLIGIYISSVVILVDLMDLTYSPLISAVSAVLVAFLFLPVKNSIQNFVDKKFFRIKYNYRTEVKRIISSLTNFNDIKSLADFMINEINSLIPVELIGLYRITGTGNSTLIVSNNNKSFQEWVDLNKNKLALYKDNIIADTNKIEKEVKAFIIESFLLKDVNLALVVPLITENKKFSAFLLIGNKLSGLKFTIEDVDLLKSIISTALTTIERILLQEELIQERYAAEKLEELVKQKSLYVSLVSHDLKIPLTSIKMFTELILQDKSYLSDKIRAHLNTIENETDRLARLVTNILDVSRIEKGIKAYNKKRIQLNKVVMDLISINQTQIEKEGFIFKYELTDFEDSILADEDALKQAVENLISNALKYSRQSKKLFIRTYSANNYAVIDVEDCGIGISESDKKKIFDPYFRIENDSSGTGLGLYIVKYIMDAHDGEIEVNSTPLKGTSVRLKFPRIINQDKEGL